MRRPGVPLAQRFTCAGGSASPAQISTRTGPSASSARPDSTIGGRVAWVMPSRATSAARVSPANTSPGAPRCSEAPWLRAIDHSNTQASKLKDANCSTRLSGDTPNSSPCTRCKLGKPRWVTITPLGRPVEPDV